MKKITFMAFCLTLSSLALFSQPTTTMIPANAAILHYQLAVGFHTTTVLIFPAAIREADRGEKSLLAQKQPGAENILKVKAGRIGFSPTNLHVFMVDGRLYAFDVVYSEDPPITTYDLGKITAQDSAVNNHAATILLPQVMLDSQQIEQQVVSIKTGRPFFSRHSRKYSMDVRLAAIYHSNNRLFFSFKISNRSNLPYQIDFSSLTIQDKKRIRRASIQERNIAPLYNDTLTSIPARCSANWVVAIPQLTLQDHRQLCWQMFEKNGGRLLAMKVTNRQLFKAKSL